MLSIACIWNKFRCAWRQSEFSMSFDISNEQHWIEMNNTQPINRTVKCRLNNNSSNVNVDGLVDALRDSCALCLWCHATRMAWMMGTIWICTLSHVFVMIWNVLLSAGCSRQTKVTCGKYKWNSCVAYLIVTCNVTCHTTHLLEYSRLVWITDIWIVYVFVKAFSGMSFQFQFGSEFSYGKKVNS